MFANALARAKAPNASGSLLFSCSEWQQHEVLRVLHARTQRTLTTRLSMPEVQERYGL